MSSQSLLQRCSSKVALTGLGRLPTYYLDAIDIPPLKCLFLENVLSLENDKTRQAISESP